MLSSFVPQPLFEPSFVQAKPLYTRLELPVLQAALLHIVCEGCDSRLLAIYAGILVLWRSDPVMSPPPFQATHATHLQLPLKRLTQLRHSDELVQCIPICIVCLRKVRGVGVASPSEGLEWMSDEACEGPYDVRCEPQTCCAQRNAQAEQEESSQEDNHEPQQYRHKNGIWVKGLSGPRHDGVHLLIATAEGLIHPPHLLRNEGENCAHPREQREKKKR